ncbi:MAG: hypothetical protein M1833_004951 [Piccolia ochrophora]|nr:MAG: hypothetical protein M1833_004951 [Piccolia ochrophora]
MAVDLQSKSVEASNDTEQPTGTDPDFARFLSGPLVDVFVGPQREHWRLHRDLLCHQSVFFEAAFCGRFNEAEQGRLEFPEDSAGAFTLFILWLYRGSIEPPRFSRGNLLFRDHLELYYLSDKLSIEPLRNVVMDQLRASFRKNKRIPTPSTIKNIYENTPPSSPLRKWAAKVAAREILRSTKPNPAARYECCMELGADFAKDLVNSIMLDSIRKSSAQLTLTYPDAMSGSDCEFHEHHEDEKACSCDRRSASSSPASSRKSSPSSNRQKSPTSRPISPARQKAFEALFDNDSPCASAGTP